MSSSQYLRRGGLTVESVSTFNSLGLSSSSASVPLIMAAHARQKNNKTSHNAAACEPNKQARPPANSESLSQEIVHGADRSPFLEDGSLTPSTLDMVELDRTSDVSRGSMFSTQRQNSLSHILQKDAAYPSRVMSSLAKFALPHTEPDIAPTSPFCAMVSDSKTPCEMNYDGSKVATGTMDRFTAASMNSNMKLHDFGPLSSLNKQTTETFKQTWASLGDDPRHYLGTSLILTL